MYIHVQMYIEPDNDFLFKSDYSDSVAGDACFREPFKQLTSRELDFHGLRKKPKDQAGF